MVGTRPLLLFPFPLFTLLVHRHVPIASTGVNRRDRHLCIRTRQISGDLPRRTIPTFAAAGKDHLLPQENFFWCRRKIRHVAASDHYGHCLPHNQPPEKRTRHICRVFAAPTAFGDHGRRGMPRSRHTEADGEGIRRSVSLPRRSSAPASVYNLQLRH